MLRFHVGLDRKTDEDAVLRQARWAGVEQGMRLADLGCGSGETTAVLHGLVGPAGEAVGVDISEERISFAREKYHGPGLEFHGRPGGPVYSAALEEGDAS